MFWTVFAKQMDTNNCRRSETYAEACFSICYIYPISLQDHMSQSQWLATLADSALPSWECHHKIEVQIPLQDASISLERRELWCLCLYIHCVDGGQLLSRPVSLAVVARYAVMYQLLSLSVIFNWRVLRFLCTTRKNRYTFYIPTVNSGQMGNADVIEPQQQW